MPFLCVPVENALILMRMKYKKSNIFIVPVKTLERDALESNDRNYSDLTLFLIIKHISFISRIYSYIMSVCSRPTGRMCLIIMNKLKII